MVILGRVSASPVTNSVGHIISEQWYAFVRSAIMKPTAAASMANIWLGITNLTQTSQLFVHSATDLIPN